MSTEQFLEKLRARRRELSDLIAKTPRNPDGTVSLTRTAVLRKERAAIDKAISNAERQKL